MIIQGKPNKIKQVALKSVKMKNIIDHLNVCKLGHWIFQKGKRPIRRPYRSLTFSRRCEEDGGRQEGIAQGRMLL